MNITGRRIRELRIERGLSQCELSERMRALGCRASERRIARIESGEANVYLSDIFAIADIFCVPPADLFRDATRM